MAQFVRLNEVLAGRPGIKKTDLMAQIRVSDTWFNSLARKLQKKPGEYISAVVTAASVCNIFTRNMKELESLSMNSGVASVRKNACSMKIGDYTVGINVIDVSIMTKNDREMQIRLFSYVHDNTCYVTNKLPNITIDNPFATD